MHAGFHADNGLKCTFTPGTTSQALPVKSSAMPWHGASPIVLFCVLLMSDCSWFTPAVLRLFCDAVCLDTKAVGIGLAIYTLVIACFSGFLGPIIVGALVQQMGSFSEAMVVNGAVMIGAGLLMVGLSVWERRQARHRHADVEEHAVVAADRDDGEQPPDIIGRRDKDIELARA